MGQLLLDTSALPAASCADAAAAGDDPGAEAARVSAATLPWESLVRPIPYLAVAHAWSEVCKPQSRPFSWGCMHSLMERLQDASLISVRHDDLGVAQVWPASAAQVVLGHSDSAALTSIQSMVRMVQPLERALREAPGVAGALSHLAKGL